MAYHKKCFPDGSKSIETWNDGDGNYHREDGPAYIQYYSNGKVMKEKWYTHGVLHSDTTPSIKMYHTNGELNGIIWYTHGVLHREDGPALIRYENKISISEGWFLNGINISNYIRDFINIFIIDENKWTRDDMVLFRLWCEYIN